MSPGHAKLNTTDNAAKTLDLIKIIKKEDILDTENISLITRLNKSLNNAAVKRLNPKPKLISRTEATDQESKSNMKTNKNKSTPAQAKKSEEPKPSYDDLIKMISNLNRTIENLSKQLEEERKRKNPPKVENTVRAELLVPQP